MKFWSNSDIPSAGTQVPEKRLLAAVLQRAQPGWFSPRSWTYWQLKLGLATSGMVPPLPQRHFGD